ncbi:MAG: presenilin family intramembrane aspartyl protease [bacterium]
MKSKKGDYQTLGVFLTQGLFWLGLAEFMVFYVRLKARANFEMESFSLAILALVVLFSFLLAYFLTRADFGLKVYAILVYAAILIGALTYASLVLPWPFALLTLPVVAGIFLFSPRVIWQNLMLTLALSGIAIQFSGLLTWRVAVALILALSLYDFIAVKITHHMIRLARAVVNIHVPAIYVIPLNYRDLFSHVNRFFVGSKAIFLGGGDVALPAMLVVAAPNNRLALGVALGNLAGFAFMAYLFGRRSVIRPLPALPFISFGGLLGALIFWIIL